ncbi:hypothetical protein WJX74_010590 [Apatococcus lobatus]|uniref:Uncharacterized protein n=1 Tax=Apatococcus lobatus TaxID=904363 RepID=A0AAW1Q9H2_9CHLO
MAASYSAALQPNPGQNNPQPGTGAKAMYGYHQGSYALHPDGAPPAQPRQPVQSAAAFQGLAPVRMECQDTGGSSGIVRLTEAMRFCCCVCMVRLLQRCS